MTELFSSFQFWIITIVQKYNDFCYCSHVLQPCWPCLSVLRVCCGFLRVLYMQDDVIHSRGRFPCRSPGRRPFMCSSWWMVVVKNYSTAFNRKRGLIPIAGESFQPHHRARRSQGSSQCSLRGHRSQALTLDSLAVTADWLSRPADSASMHCLHFPPVHAYFQCPFHPGRLLSGL